MAYNVKNCDDADRLIQKALDGELTPTEREALDKHMAACATCAAAWQEHRELARRTTAWARRPAANTANAQDFAAAVLAQIVARPQPNHGPAVPAWVFRVAASCFALILVAASYFLMPKVPNYWSAPQIPTLTPDTPVTAWSGIERALRNLPSDAVATWNSLLPEHVSYYPALAALGLALGLALVLKIQSQRPRGRAR
jgi:hypothetical protein